MHILQIIMLFMASDINVLVGCYLSISSSFVSNTAICLLFAYGAIHLSAEICLWLISIVDEKRNSQGMNLSNLVNTHNMI